MQALAGLCLVRSAVEPPAWLGSDSPTWPPHEILAGRNGLVHLPSLIAGRESFAPPTPRLLTRNVLDYDLDLDAAAPTAWLAFLGRLWPEDAGRGRPSRVVRLLLAAGHQPAENPHDCRPAAIRQGDDPRVLGRLVGMANVCAPTLAGLATNFGLWPLLGKTVAIISDARLSGRADVNAVVERLLSISGEDAQTIDRKNLSQVTCKLPVRFVIMTNELPRLDDPSGADRPHDRLAADPQLVRSGGHRADGSAVGGASGHSAMGHRRMAALAGARPVSAAGIGVAAGGRPGGPVQPDRGVRAGAVRSRPRIRGAGRTCSSCGKHGARRRAAATAPTPVSAATCTALPDLDDRRPRDGENRVRVYVGIRLTVTVPDF